MSAPPKSRELSAADDPDWTRGILNPGAERYLGVSPKWTLCRFRIQEAAQRVAQGHVVDWAALASELGYFDQAHFSSDKAQIGKTPSEYAAMTREAGGRERQG